MAEPFVDIHCHLLPGIDDGARDLTESLAMARMAVEDGITAVVCTPHQAGAFSSNRGEAVRSAVDALRNEFAREEIPLEILPGGDVRIESELVKGLISGEILSLGDHHRHVLLELPHELYFPLEGLHAELMAEGIIGILSHPERNQGILDRPSVVKPLVELGVLMQITAGSLVGTFGETIQKFSEDLLCKGLVHFISTDAHSPKRRRPLMRRAFDRAVELVGADMATALCCRNPRAVADGQEVQGGLQAKPSRSLMSWFSRRGAA